MESQSSPADVCLVDTSVIMHAAGRHHPLREPCRAWLHAFAAGGRHGAIDVEVLQEILHRYTAAGDPLRGVTMAEATLDLFPPPLGFDAADARRVVTLMASFGSAGLRPRDAVHAAIAEHARIADILSPDRHFDLIPGLRRIDPLREQP